MKKKVFIIDTSAILSGKSMNMDNASLLTTPGISDELTPGGRDFQIFELLKELGLQVLTPSQKAIDIVKKTARETGDDRRLSKADIEIVALAIDSRINQDQDVIILSDDYSIQNVASALHIRYEGIVQKGITKKFKWASRCPGCKRKFNDIIKICPICGTATKSYLLHKKNL